MNAQSKGQPIPAKRKLPIVPPVNTNRTEDQYIMFEPNKPRKPRMTHEAQIKHWRPKSGDPTPEQMMHNIKLTRADAGRKDGKFHPMSSQTDSRLRDNDNDHAVRKAWCIMGHMIEGGQLELPTTDLIGDDEKVKALEDIHSMVMSISWILLRVYVPGNAD